MPRAGSSRSRTIPTQSQRGAGGIMSMSSSRRRFVFRCLLPLIAGLALLAIPAHADRDSPRWVGTWSAAMQATFPSVSPATFTNVTLRQVVRITIGGASVGVRSDGSSVRAGSLRTLRFGGASSISVPPGAVAITDPVLLHLDAQDDLAISLYVPGSQAG